MNSKNLNAIHRELCIKQEILEMPVDYVPEDIEGIELNPANANNIKEEWEHDRCVNTEGYRFDEDLYVHDIKQEELIIKTEEPHCSFSLSDEPQKHNLSFATLSDSSMKETSGELFFCYSCKYKTDKKRYLVDHQKIHFERKFFCTICKFKTVKKSGLVRHTRTHTGEKPYGCDVCGEKYADKTSLKYHLPVHSGGNPFRCSTCDYNCQRRADFNQHIRIHTGKKLFRCDVCDYSCPGRVDFIRHVRIHTGEKPYKCDICGYKCTVKGRLNRHIKGHLNREMRTCTLCDFKSMYKGWLKRHMQTIHPTAKNRTKEASKKLRNHIDVEGTIDLNEKLCRTKENLKTVNQQIFQLNAGSNLEQEVVTEVIVYEESLWQDEY